MPVERNVVEQRYEAVMSVSRDRQTVAQAALVYGVSRQTLHKWVRRYEARGMPGLMDVSHRPQHSPNRAAAAAEAAACEFRRRHPSWGPRRIVHELASQGTTLSRATAYSILVRQHLIESLARRRPPEGYKH